MGVTTTTYYYGWESLAEWGVEGPTNSSSYGTAVTPDEGFAYLKSASINANANVEALWLISGSRQRKAADFIKGQFETTASLTFNVANDMDATTLDSWILKMPFDAFNVAHDGTTFVIPNTGTSTYGSNVLMGFTLEIGHNKSGNIRMHKLAGCAVDSFTVRAREGEPVEFTMDLIVKTASFNESSFTAGSVSRSSKPPFTWGDCTVYYADDNTQTARQEITELEFTVNNNLKPKYDLSNSTTLEFNRLICGRQEITGSFTIDLTTESGQDLYDALTGDASAAYANSTTVSSKEVGLLLGDGTNGVEWRLRDCAITEVPMDIDPENETQVTVPFQASYYAMNFNTPDTQAITNWDDQSA